MAFAAALRPLTVTGVRLFSTASHNLASSATQQKVKTLSLALIASAAAALALRVSFARGSSSVDKLIKKESPLYVAVQEGRTDDVVSLLEQGADPHQPNDLSLLSPESRPIYPKGHGVTPFELAIEKGDLKTVQLFAKTGIDLNHHLAGKMSPLCKAISEGQEGIALFFLKTGVELNSRDPMISSPIRLATELGLLSTVQELHKRGAFLIEFCPLRASLLHDAVRHPEVLKYLLAQDEMRPLINLYNILGQTPIASAVEEGKLESVQLLTEAGADLSLPCRYRRETRHLLWLARTKYEESELSRFSSKQQTQNRMAVWDYLGDHYPA